MQFNEPTFLRPRTVRERLYPPGVLVEDTFRVWAHSDWRGSVQLAHDFLTAGYLHLPPGTPRMFRLNENRDGVRLRLLTVVFTNPYGTYALLGHVFWCGFESIFFTLYNIYTNYDIIFPTPNHMHCLPYEEEEE
ncbi:unnamed protein product [Alopecurus aequalis]